MSTNNFNFPSNRVAAENLIKEIKTQELNLIQKETRLQREIELVEEKIRKLDKHRQRTKQALYGNTENLAKLRGQVQQLEEKLPQLLETPSAAEAQKKKAKAEGITLDWFTTATK